MQWSSLSSALNYFKTITLNSDTSNITLAHHPPDDSKTPDYRYDIMFEPVMLHYRHRPIIPKLHELKIFENHIRDTFSWCNDPKHLATKPIPLPKIPLTNVLRKLQRYQKGDKKNWVAKLLSRATGLVGPPFGRTNEHFVPTIFLHPVLKTNG